MYPNVEFPKREPPYKLEVSTEFPRIDKSLIYQLITFTGDQLINESVLGILLVTPKIGFYGQSPEVIWPNIF